MIDKLPTITVLSFDEQNEQKLDFTISVNVIFNHYNLRVEKFPAKLSINLFSPRNLSSLTWVVLTIHESYLRRQQEFWVSNWEGFELETGKEEEFLELFMNKFFRYSGKWICNFMKRRLNKKNARSTIDFFSDLDRILVNANNWAICALAAVLLEICKVADQVFLPFITGRFPVIVKIDVRLSV